METVVQKLGNSSTYDFNRDYKSITNADPIRPKVRTLEYRFVLDTVHLRSAKKSLLIEEQIERQANRQLEQMLEKEMPSIYTTGSNDLYTNKIKEIFYDDVSNTVQYKYLIDYCNTCSTDTTATYILPKRKYYCDGSDNYATTWTRGYAGSWDNVRSYTSNDCQWRLIKEDPVPLPPPGSRLRDIIQARQAPMLIVPNRKPLVAAPDIREIRARETLRRIVGDDRFRRFLKNAFIHVRGKSGKSYQIFTGHGMTNVFENGQQVERLCVVLDGDFAPTDSLLMRYLLILNSEEEFRKLAISHSVYNPAKFRSNEPDLRPLPEIFRSLKAVA